MGSYWNVISILCFVILAEIPSTIPSESAPLTIVYNSKDKQDGPFQESLFRGAFLGLMEADTDSTLNPIFLDLGLQNMTEEIGRILQQNSKTILSLLSCNELRVFISHFVEQRKKNSEGSDPTVVMIFTPRAIPSHHFNATLMNVNHLRLMSLQPNDKVRATVILNRVAKVRTRILTPVLDDQSQLPLLRIYHHLASKYFPNVMRFKRPVFLFPSNPTPFPNLPRQVPSSRGNSLQFLEPRSKRDANQTGAETTGILLLSSKWLPESADGFWSEDHFFRWFSHNPIQEVRNGFQVLFGMYTVQYVGSSNWDSRLRRNVIRELGNSSDPSPNVLSAILAFDAATVAASHAKHGQLPTPLKGMSGEIKFDAEGFRAGEAICQGISALSANKSPYAMLLQNSSWMLEDALQIRGNKSMDFEVTDYQVATSSFISPKTLIEFVKTNMTEDVPPCPRISLEVLAHDPFNQHPYRYIFTPENLPLILLIPNQFGYGLKLLCQNNTALETILEIGCTSDGSSVAASVHCFQSRIRSREKRSPVGGSSGRVHNSFFGNQREDNSNSLSYDVQPPPVSAPMQPYMGNSYNGYSGASSESPMTTTEEATTTTEAPAPSPGPKLPDLRGILKGVMPFVGGCVGAATGCSVCVVVLGRLPLGGLPAICTGPCFVTTFANCGALLGRTFAETTVVCTELFRQGRLDLETFLVDAEFGNRLAKESIHTLRGYQKLASPIVSRMRTSETVTKIVEFFARPWAQHMKYLMGRSTNFTWVGFLIHGLGMRLCGAFGHLDAFLENAVDRSLSGVMGGVGIATLMLILIMRKNKVLV